MTHDVIGYASQQHPARSLASSSPDDQQLYRLCLRHGDDARAGIPGPDDELGVDALVSGALDQRHKGLLALGPRLVDPGMRSESGESPSIEDVDDQEATVQPPGQADRAARCHAGRRRQIRGEAHRADGPCRWAFRQSHRFGRDGMFGMVTALIVVPKKEDVDAIVTALVA